MQKLPFGHRRRKLPSSTTLVGAIGSVGKRLPLREKFGLSLIIHSRLDESAGVCKNWVQELDVHVPIGAAAVGTAG